MLVSSVGSQITDHAGEGAGVEGAGVEGAPDEEVIC